VRGRWGSAVTSVLVAGLLGAAPAATATSAAPRNRTRADRPAGVPSPVCRPRTTSPVARLRVVHVQPITARVTRYTFFSSALGGQVRANVLLPAGYADPAQAARRYPVLLLLHGAAGDADDWVRHGVERVVGDTPMIVVMPDGGTGGWYTDWFGAEVTRPATFTPPAWETFHLRELLPWVDATFRTIADRQHRVIAGLSMGGFGTMSYAARHPDLFVAAGSFSGAVDTDLMWPLLPMALGYVGTPPSMCIWGDPVTQQANLEGHDPTVLAPSLGDTTLFAAWGNGQAGPLDTPSSQASGLLEMVIAPMNAGFVQAVQRSGIPITAWSYGPGTHSWPYWLRDLAKFLPMAMAAIARPSPTPATDPTHPFDYRSAEPTFGVWGWTFRARHDPQAFTDLTSVTRSGLTVRGAGQLDVTTPPLYRPGAAYLVSGAQEPAPGIVIADRRGRLTFTVDLADRAPAAAVASLSALGQFLAQPLPLDGTVAGAAHVTIRPLA
jgi:S-formylglutathione hydrolase FrmB